MAQAATGEVIERSSRRGRTHAIRFRAYGKRRLITLGTEREGWTRRKAEEELANVMADVRRGIWRPPEPIEPVEAPGELQTFHEFASAWFEGIEQEGLRPSTLAAYRSELCIHLLPFFAEHTLAEITIAEVDRYRQAKVTEERLSGTSINSTITRLAQILEVAVERELIPRNPARGKRRRLKARKPQRAMLDRAEPIEALLVAASELDAEARVDRRCTPRAALLATLVLSGVRIGEALALRWADVDLAGGRMRISDSKTDAGVRQIDLLPVLREELTGHKASTPYPAADDFVFPTENGKGQNASNIRNRVLAMSVARANDNLAAHNRAPLPEGLTPHSLRHTFISLLLAIGEDVPYVMGQVGHADPKMTLSIYAQVMFRGEGERGRLQSLIDGNDWAQAGTNAEIGLLEPSDRPDSNDEKP